MGEIIITLLLQASTTQKIAFKLRVLEQKFNFFQIYYIIYFSYHPRNYKQQELLLK